MRIWHPTFKTANHWEDFLWLVSAQVPVPSTLYKYTMTCQSNTTKLYYVYYCIRATCFDSRYQEPPVPRLGFGQDEPWSDTWQEQKFSLLQIVRKALGPTQPPNQWVLEVLPSRRGSWPLTIPTEVKSEWSYTSAPTTPSWHGQGHLQYFSCICQGINVTEKFCGKKNPIWKVSHKGRDFKLQVQCWIRR